MAINYKNPEINKKYIAVFGIAVFISWILHEFAHWIMGESLGYKMGMTLNTTFPLSGQYAGNLDYQLVSVAGPLFTVCEAMLVFILMIRRRRFYLYPLLFTCFYMRLFATILSIRNPNDEARIGTAIGIGKFTMPLVVTLILFTLVYRVSVKYGFKTRFNLANFALAIVFSSVLMIADMYFKMRLI